MTAIPTALPAFYPETNSTLAATTTSGNTPVQLGAIGDTIMVFNDSNTTVFLAFGNSSVTVTAGGSASATSDGGYAVGGGMKESIRVNDPGAGVWVAGITAAGTATVRLSRGSGV